MISARERREGTVTEVKQRSYRVVEGWEKAPANANRLDAVGVGTDSRDRVYLITRQRSQVLVYEPDGTFVRAWGEGQFTDRTHGLTVAPDDTIWCVDDGSHRVQKFSPEGKLLLELEAAGRPAPESGYDGRTLESITRGGPPFNRPTNLAVAPSGELYVSDGYGNCRVHRYSAEGKLIQSWGEPGRGPGQFILPHGIWVAADGRVLVADRENDRIQVFSPGGEYLTEWAALRPTDLCVDGDGLVYVSELGRRPGPRPCGLGEAPEQPGRVSVLDQGGNVVARFGASETERCAPGNFVAPHCIAVDSKGGVYVGEVTYTIGVRPGLVSADCHTVQKFERV
jgi:DNA-binding beta-propeller fold protein YncE